VKESRTLYLDIEDVGNRLLLVGWALDDGDVVVAEPHPGRQEWLDALSNPSITKVCQGDHDLRWFLMHGYEVAGPFHNTMVMAWVLDENQALDQESLTKRYVPARVKHKTITSRGGRLYFNKRWPLDEYDSWPPAVKWQFQQYNGRDVETMRMLYQELRRRLAREWERYWETEEVPYSSVVLRMEVRGMPIDLGATAALADTVRGLRTGAEAKLRDMAALPPPFNLNSPDQVREYLFSKFCALPGRLPMSMDPLPSDQDFEVTKVARDYIHGKWLFKGRGLTPTDPPKRKGQDSESTEPSTASPELLYKHGTDPFVQTLCLEYRRYDKLLGTYLEKFPKVAVEVDYDPDDTTTPYTRIFGQFVQTGTVTGRLSSREPNLQNIPARRDLGKQVRGLFKGNLVIGDYDALEMRLMAHFSGDPRLTAVFAEGRDPHEETAHAIFGACDGHDDPRRDVGKTVNYAIGYGAGARTLAKTLSLAGYPTTQAEAKGYQETVAGFYRRLYRWSNAVIWRAKDTGYVSTIGGRSRRLTPPVEGVASWKLQSYGERQAVNSIVQGSAADVLRRVMLACDREYWGSMVLIAQVHDELLWEYKPPRPSLETLRSLQHICENGHGFDLSVPLTFTPMVCGSWQDKGTGTDIELEEMQP
jgi:DNA polymerase I-like protein with 3'-5' exonuclease and polymerase domains